MKALLVLTLFICWPAFADSTFSLTNQDGKLTLTTKPCTLGPWFEKWREAHWIYRGKSYEACWSTQNRYVIVIDSSGVVTPIEAAVFKKDEAV